MTEIQEFEKSLTEAEGYLRNLTDAHEDWRGAARKFCHLGEDAVATARKLRARFGQPAFAALERAEAFAKAGRILRECAS